MAKMLVFLGVLTALAVALSGPRGALYAVAFTAYWLPAIVAAMRHHHQVSAITLVNLFFGWTGIGWIGALVWSVSAVQQTRAPSHEYGRPG